MLERKAWTRILIGTVGLLFTAGQTRGDLDYQFIDLGALYSTGNSFGLGVNNLGQATGRSESYNGWRTFLYSNGVMQNLGDMGLGADSAFHGQAINEQAHIVGWATDYSPMSPSAAYIYRGPDDYEFLGSLDGDTTMAEDINDFDQVVGRSLVGMEMQAFLWENGVMTDLGTLGGQNSYATAINNAGQIVGYSDSNPIEGVEHRQAFIREDGVMRCLVPDGGYSAAHDINESGVVVGQAVLSTSYAAFRWSEEEGMVELPGKPNGWHSAEAVNNLGQVVGYDLFSNHALTWIDGELIDLAELVADTGWLLTQAYDVNDSGWITGTGGNPDGFTHAYMMRLPEPGTITMLMLGLMVGGSTYRRKHR